MPLFRLRSIRSRLIAVMLVVTVCALAVAGAVQFLLDIQRGRDALAQEFNALANLVGNRSSAALQFRDEALASENLAALSGQDAIELACLFGPDGQVFARYGRSAAAGPCSLDGALAEQRVSFERGLLRVQRPLLHDGRLIGGVLLQSGVAPLAQQLRRGLQSVAIASVVAIVLALLLVARLQRRIADPIVQVRDVANSIIERGDMSLRAPPMGEGEVGQLARAFNRMLDTVKRQNDELASRDAYSRSLFHDSQVAQAVTEMDRGRFVDCNRAAQELFGHGGGQALKALSILDLAPALQPDGRPSREVLDEALDRLRTGGSTQFGLCLHRPDGSHWDAEINVVQTSLLDRMLLHFSFHDVTAAHAAAAALRARQAAEAASEAKTTFLSRMSHELRTPLNAILGLMQLLERSTQDRLHEPERRQLQLCLDAAWHLLALIEDILDVARIEAGSVQLELRPLALGPLLQDAVAMGQTLASSQGVRVGVQDAAEVWVQADPTRLRQVVINLLSNGIKYNRPGGQVQVVVTRHGDTVSIEVIDNGHGMTGEQMQHLYEPFNRLGRERGAVDGSGIGLLLTRQLVQLMKGQLEIESRAGSGTTARVVLDAAESQAAMPVSAPLRAPAADVVHEPPRGIVVYIEDNPVNQLLIEQCLLGYGELRLVQAEDGRTGLQRVREHQPDLVLLDMQLPDMSGLEVLAELKRGGWLERTRVVALSASAMPDDIARARRAGVMDYWTKPIDLARFTERLVGVLALPVDPTA